MSKKVVMFDFDGTLADSFDLVVQTFNELAPRFRCKQVTGEDIVKLREETSYEMLREFGLTKWKLPFFLIAARYRMQTRASTLKPHPGIASMLRHLHNDDGVRLCVLTSNSVQNVDAFCYANDLVGIFSIVISHKKLFGKHNAIKKFTDEYDVPAEKIIYVGDETRDMEAAKRAGVTAVAVTWGFQSRPVLATTTPDILCDTVEDLERFLHESTTT